MKFAKPVKVLRFWHRMSLMPEVQALSAVACWWLYALSMQWSGENNGIIEFARKRHGAAYGLDDSRVFARARRDVLATRLVEVTRDGGRNLPALYALALIPRQVAPPRNPWVTTTPNDAKHSWVTTTPNGTKNRVTTTPKLGDDNTQGIRPVLKNARASAYRKDFCESQTITSTASQVVTAANPDAGQGGDVQTEARVGNGGMVLPLASMHCLADKP